jgi:hypothetical protein
MPTMSDQNSPSGTGDKFSPFLGDQGNAYSIKATNSSTIGRVDNSVQVNAGVQKKGGRPRKNPAEKVPVRPIHFEMPEPLFAKMDWHRAAAGLTRTAVLCDAVRVYVALDGRKRRPRLGEAEQVFRDMARLLQLIVRLENHVDDIEERYCGDSGNTLAIVRLELAFAEIKPELRAIRRQLADHLSLLPPPRRK